MDPDTKPGEPDKKNAGGAQTPQRLIRTYAADSAVAERGGVPELAPYDAAVSGLSVRPESKPEPEKPVLRSIPFEVDAPPAPFLRPEPPPAPIEPPLNLSPIETYTADFSDQVKDSHASVATMLAAEGDRAPVEEPTPAPAPQSARQNVTAIAIGLALLIVGGVGAYYAYRVATGHTTPVSLAPTVSAPIFVDESAEVTGVGADLRQEIEQSIAAPLAAGAFRLLYLPQSSTTTPTVFSALDLDVPGELSLNILPEGSMAGIVNVNGAQSVFFILAVASYGDTFAGMLNWEPTMPRDLADLYPPITSAPPASTGTTTTPVAVLPTSGSFVDEVVDNHNARAYRIGDAPTTLIYGYWSQGTLIIAQSEAAFAAILDRLSSSSGS